MVAKAMSLYQWIKCKVRAPFSLEWLNQLTQTWQIFSILQVDYLIQVNTYSNSPHSDEMESNEVETRGSTAVNSYRRSIYLQKTEKKTWLQW